MVVLIAAVLFVYILLIVETDMLSTEIQELKKTEKRMLDEREELQAQQVGLSGFGRIEKLAKALGLEHPSQGNVIEIPSE
ncbi:MAG: hypothetical protein ACE5HO_11370 [bacterium]